MSFSDPSSLLPSPPLSNRDKNLNLYTHSISTIHPTASTSTSSTASSASSPPSSKNRKSVSSRSSPKPERKKRTTPCERCRRIRKRCDFSIPCSRCSNARSECVYISARSRAEEDRERVVIYEEVFDDVEDVLLGVEEMEKEVRTLRGIYNGPTDPPASEEHYGIPPLSDTYSDASSPFNCEEDSSGQDSGDDYPSPPDYHFEKNPPFPPESFENPVILSESLAAPSSSSMDESIRAIANKPVNWQMSVSKNGIRVETNIRTLEDLKLFLVASMTKTQVNQAKHLVLDLIPLPPGQLWRQFKWFFSSQLHIDKHAIHVRKLILPDATSYPAPLRRPAILYPDNKNPETVRIITAHLMEVFFSCVNTRYPILHKPHFLECYYDRQNPTRSPVVCALSAWMVTSYCPHLFPAPKWNVPADARRAWGNFFFELALDQEEDMFDEPSYENFMCLLFMTQYFMRSQMYSRAESYIKHAMRVTDVLMAKYKDQSSTAPLEKHVVERETFKRLAVYSIGVQRAVVLVVGKGRFGCVNDVCAIMGIPKALPVEDAATGKIVAIMNFLIGLEDILTGIQVRPNMIPIEDVPRLEKLLINWWTTVPSALKPRVETEGPALNGISIIPRGPAEVSAQMCLNYHSCWILMHARLLPDPENPLLHAYLDDPFRRAAYEEIAGINSERSILICTRSARIVTALVDQLERAPPCGFDYHALPQALDCHQRLAKLDPLDEITQKYLILSKDLSAKLFVERRATSAGASRPLVKREKVSEGSGAVGGGLIVGGGDDWWEAL